MTSTDRPRRFREHLLELGQTDLSASMDPSNSARKELDDLIEWFERNKGVLDRTSFKFQEIDGCVRGAIACRDLPVRLTTFVTLYILFTQSNWWLGGA